MEKIKIDDFTRYKFLSGIKHSPDGKYACFTVHGMDVDENKYNSNLWVYSIEDKKHFQLTSFDSERSFIWMDDSKTILFLDVRDSRDKETRESGEEFTQYYSINIHGGEALKAFRISKSVSAIKVIDENTFVFTASHNIGIADIDCLDDGEREKELKKRKEERDYEVLEEIPYWSNGGGFTSKKRSRLYTYHRDTNKIDAITGENTDVESFNLNRERNKVVFVAQNFEGKMALTNDIYVYNICENTIEKLTNLDGWNYEYVNFITDNELIFTASDMKKYGVNENRRFYIYNFGTKQIKSITPDFDRSLWSSVGSDCRYGGSQNMQIDREYLYFATTEVDSTFLNRVDVSGKIERVITNNGSVDGCSVKNGEVLFIGMRGTKLQELYRLGDVEEQITDFNGWINRQRSVASLEKLSVETEPGVVIDGWVMKPVDFEEDKKYPAILDIHGGPKTVYGEVFVHEMQYWANEGYVVFFCNPRGSDGKGNEFADIRGKYGTIDYDDIMKFTDEVLERYNFIDGDRVGVTGGSYGGYMTNWIIGHTDRFKAAASQRSISNWISKFCTTDIGYYFVDDQNGGTPWSNQEKLWWHSPLKYADKVKTPTLFIHSEEDYRCWLAEGLQMFTALKYHGVEARLCMFRGENHELSRSGKPKHRLRRLREITDWFDKYLKA